MQKIDFKTYWNKVYTKKEVEELGWYEENPEQSLQLIDKCILHKNAHLLNVGTGASTLVDKLLQLGYDNITASDISFTSMEKLKSRLGKEESKRVQWIVDDLTNPMELLHINHVDLWHDRAVLHFLTEESDQNEYFKLLKSVVKAEGYIIIAVFNFEGASVCSGLPVYRYNTKMLEQKLGVDFNLLETYDYTYVMPSGDTRKYVYTLFKRVS